MIYDPNNPVMQIPNVTEMHHCSACGLNFHVKDVHYCTGKQTGSVASLLSEAFKTLDKVNHPDHYKVGGIETIDYMKAKLTKEQYAGYLLGNVIKYTSRYQHKNGVEDLKKAQWYLQRLISETDVWEDVKDGCNQGLDK